jgi:hypothetical protein
MGAIAGYGEGKAMRLDVFIEGRLRPVEVSEETLRVGAGFFDKMDRDMDTGWKIGPEFIERPDRVQRAQIAASRLLLAIEAGKDDLVQAMAGYIVSRLPEVRSVHIDTTGQPLQTELLGASGEPL